MEDRIEDEVRKRLAEVGSSAGLAQGRLSQEVLFLLPPEFVRMYRDLFDRALGDPVQRAGDGGKDAGRLKANGKSKDPLRARSRAGAQGGGKKFVAGAWPVKSELALEEKRKLDRAIVRAAEKAIGAAAGRPTAQAQTLRCAGCGRVMSADWVRCPFHND